MTSCLKKLTTKIFFPLAMMTVATLSHADSISYGINSLNVVNAISGNAIAPSSATVTSYFSVAGSTFTVSPNGIISGPSQPYVRATVGTMNLKNATSVQMFFSAPSAANNVQNMWGGATSSGTFTVPVGGAGRYHLNMHQFIAFDNVNIIDFQVNGSPVSGCYFTRVTLNNSGMQCQTSVNLNSGDVVQVFFNQSSGSDQVPNTNAVYSYFTMEKVW